MSNPYYEPKEMGLQTIAEIEYSDGNYQFDTRVVWKHTDTDKFYTARDSGCSCPTPFEDYTTIESLEPFDFKTIHDEVFDEVLTGDLGTRVSDAQEFMEKLRGAR